MQQKSRKHKSFIENLTSKLFISGYTLFVVFLLSMIIIRIMQGGFHEFLMEANSAILILLVMHSNYLFGFIAISKYPSLIITEKGLHLFVDLPIEILWTDIYYYKWIKVVGTYRLDLSKNKGYRKVYGKFQDFDKIVIDNIFKKQTKV